MFGLLCLLFGVWRPDRLRNDAQAKGSIRMVKIPSRYWSDARPAAPRERLQKQSAFRPGNGPGKRLDSAVTDRNTRGVSGDAHRSP